MKSSELERIAEKVRQRCIKAAKKGFKDASMSGLCTEGAAEAAIGAMQSLDVTEIVAEENGFN